MEILALDVGAKRVGIARASTEARLAEPLKTLSTDEAIEQLRQIVKENEAKMVVVGLPRNLSGDDTQQTRWVRDWVARAKTELGGIDFYWQDEALTSQVVKSRPFDKLRTRKSKVKSLGVDAQAAAIILEDFLNSDKNDRVLV